jgi:hypothetical protein
LELQANLADFWADVDTAWGTKGGAVANWYMLLYAADGEPVLPTHSPVRISRITDHYKQDSASGRWLCRYRRLETLFEGGSLLKVPADVGKARS